MQPQDMIEMYNKGSRPSDIAFKANVRTRVVRKVLADAGIEVDPASLHKPSIWDLDEDKRRDAIIRRAASGARAALAASQRKLPAPVPVKAPEPVRVRIIACEEVEQPKPKRAWKDIVAEVAEQHKVTVLDIMSARRNRTIVAARQEAMYRLRHETPLSSAQIGRLLKRDHTTVLWAVERHGAMLRGEVFTQASRPPRGAPTFWTPEKINEAETMRWRGYTFKRIAELIGASSGSAVREKLEKIGSLEAIEAASRVNWRAVA
jgi:hypothetical protein